VVEVPDERSDSAGDAEPAADRSGQPLPPGHGVDRTQIRELLKLTPRQRLELLTADVAGLARLERAAKRDERP